MNALSVEPSLVTLSGRLTTPVEGLIVTPDGVSFKDQVPFDAFLAVKVLFVEEPVGV